MGCSMIFIFGVAIISAFIGNADLSPVMNKVRMNCDFVKSDGTCAMEKDIKKRGKTSRRTNPYFLLEAKFNIKTANHGTPQESHDDIAKPYSTEPIFKAVTTLPPKVRDTTTTPPITGNSTSTGDAGIEGGTKVHTYSGQQALKSRTHLWLLPVFFVLIC